MEHNNSCSGIYLRLVSELYRDVAECYNVARKVQRIELDLIESRVASEGLSFLTKALPRFGKAVDKALSSDTPLYIIGFKTPDNSVIPKLFGWLLSRVFDSSGRELENSCPLALKYFRQLVYLLYKLEIPYAPATAKAVVDAFVDAEKELASIDAAVFQSTWVLCARDFVTRVMAPLDPYRISPKHGPGAVATGEDILEKTKFSRIYRTLDEIYPFMEWFRYNLSHVADTYRDDQSLEVLDEPTAKVVLVPKDSRGPRLISCEPLELMWIQQGLGTLIRDQIERSQWTKGHVNFTDQTINRDLALAASQGAGWVTLDMKEASDRVSTDLVKSLFGGHPALLAAMLACRSTATRLPDGTVLSLSKFAPMGSNLCFPVESLVFYALAVSAIRQTGVSWATARASVYVYGDDLIVRDEVYTTLLQLFPTVGLKFNDSKCCVAGSFRESCGCDAFKGIDVTPVKVRTTWSHRRQYDPSCLESYVALYNAMYGLGHFRVAEYVKTLVYSNYGHLPETNTYAVASNGTYISQANAIAYVCHEPCNQRSPLPTRWNSRLHHGEIRSWKSHPKKVKTSFDGYPELLRRLSDGYGSHGGSYALVRRNRLKRTWMRNL